MSHGVELTGVGKSYPVGDRSLEILKGIDLSIAPGTSLSIVGPSGSGKSTLLNLLGTLDHPTTGRILLDGRDPSTLSEAELARFRNEHVGFVFQEHQLLPQFTALENVLLPTLAFPPVPSGAEARSRDLLSSVGLGDRLHHRPASLSGGERQRAALARALIQSPSLVLCDEPTGNLDRRTGERVIELLHSLHREAGNVLVIVTHAADAASSCERHVELIDGLCVEA